MKEHQSKTLSKVPLKDLRIMVDKATELLPVKDLVDTALEHLLLVEVVEHLVVPVEMLLILLSISSELNLLVAVLVGSLECRDNLRSWMMIGLV